MYKTRLIDTGLALWAKDTNRKPLLLRGARQVGKSSAIRHLDIIPLYAIANLFA